MSLIVVEVVVNTLMDLQEDAHCMLLLKGTAGTGNFVTIRQCQAAWNENCDT